MRWCDQVVLDLGQEGTEAEAKTEDEGVRYDDATEGGAE